jgi:hypothetical protein
MGCDGGWIQVFHSALSTMEQMLEHHQYRSAKAKLESLHELRKHYPLSFDSELTKFPLAVQNFVRSA